MDRAAGQDFRPLRLPRLAALSPRGKAGLWLRLRGLCRGGLERNAEDQTGKDSRRGELRRSQHDADSGEASEAGAV